MNEGENSGNPIPRGPVFSSPNITSSADIDAAAAELIESQPSITSEEIATLSNTEAGAVAAAAAAMVEEDALPAVSSGMIATSSKIQASRHGATLMNRRFSKKQNASADASSFGASAKKDDPIIINYGKPARKSKKGLIIGSLIMMIVIVLAIIYVSMIFQNKDTVSETTKAWRRFGNYLLYGNEKEDAITIEPTVVASMIYSRGNVFINGEKSENRRKKAGELFNAAKEKTEDKSLDIVDDANSIILLIGLYSAPDTNWATSLLADNQSIDVLKGTVAEVYGKLYSSENTDEINTLIDELQTLGEKRIDLSNLYVNNGCVGQNYSLDSKCMQDVDTANFQLKTEIYNAVQKIELIAKGIMGDFYRDLAELEK